MKKGTKHSEASKRKMRQTRQARKEFSEGFNQPGLADRLRRRFNGVKR